MEKNFNKDDYNKYIIGVCKWCNECKAIKNGLCSSCEEKLTNLTGNKNIDKLFENFNDN